MPELHSIAAIVGGSGLLLLALALIALRRGRFVRAGVQGVMGALGLALGAFLIAFSLNLHTYERLTFERPIAELRFQQIAPQRFVVSLTIPHPHRVLRYLLLGDAWQLDARILKWKGFANLLGFNAHYRLERLSGRYFSVGDELSKPRAVYPLADHSGLDVWQAAQRFGRYLPWLDTEYGSAAYLPMNDGARYRVSIGQSGLIARPIERRWENGPGNQPRAF